MQTEDKTRNIRVENAELLSKLISEDDGQLKEAASVGSNMIRRRIREDGFLRSIIPQEVVTNADLDRVQDNDRPVIIEDMEPLSPGAASISFGGAADTAFYYGNKFTVVFNPITTREYTKDINELRTYRMDLRQVITDNALKDVQTEEDGTFITMVDTIVGATPNRWGTSDANLGAAGINQNWTIDGGFTRDNCVEMLSVIENQNLNNGIFLMNRRTMKNYLKFTRDQIGGDLSQDLFKQGAKALSSAEIWGTKHLFTLKRDLVPDNVVYLFTEPGFLGRNYELSPLTLYVSKQKDILKFSARETIGVSIANVAGVAKWTFNP